MRESRQLQLITDIRQIAVRLIGGFKTGWNNSKNEMDQIISNDSLPYRKDLISEIPSIVVEAEYQILSEGYRAYSSNPST